MKQPNVGINRKARAKGCHQLNIPFTVSNLAESQWKRFSFVDVIPLTFITAQPVVRNTQQVGAAKDLCMSPRQGKKMKDKRRGFGKRTHIVLAWEFRTRTIKNCIYIKNQRCLGADFIKLTVNKPIHGSLKQQCIGNPIMRANYCQQLSSTMFPTHMRSHILANSGCSLMRC